MFNRIVLSPRTETRYVTREVHEHRAPTDESVRLLKEMEKAADEKRVASIHLDPNHLNGVVQMFVRHDNDSRTLSAVVDINEKRIRVDVAQPSQKDLIELVEKLRDDLAQRLAVEVLLPALEPVMQNLRRNA